MFDHALAAAVDIQRSVGAAHVGAYPARMHQHYAEFWVVLSAYEALHEVVERGLAGAVQRHAQASAGLDAAEDRTHEHDQPVLGGQVRQQTFGHAQRGDGVGQEQLAHFLGAGLRGAVV